ncbi:sensor histidine kinase [Terasakiella sp.]|uniref:sensor histidine kinase n=1 Tax=Terasakiella sp. TaxID=2034861 RepID=UPI003AA9993A
MRKLSIRWRIQIVLIAVIVASTVMAFWVHYSADKSLYLLLRAQRSHQQLELLESLSANVNRYLLYRVLHFNHTTDVTNDLEDAAHNITKYLAQFQSITTDEIEFVRDTEEQDKEREEEGRFRQIKAALTAIDISQKSIETQEEWSRTVLPIFQQSFDILIQNAIQDEREEIKNVTEQMQASKDHLAFSGLIILLFQVSASGLVIYVLFFFLVRPLSSLIKHINTLGRCHFDDRIHRQTHDEIGLLYAHVNRMAHRLHQSRQKVHRLNQNLEEKINERTASLTESNRRLQEINDSRQRFFSDVSHELRTPLTTIIGEAEVSLRTGQALNDIETNKSLSTIQAQATFMERRIKDLLMIVKADDGRLILGRSALFLEEVVLNAVHRVQGLAKVNNIRLNCEINSKEGCRISGEADWLAQALVTILDNAIKFSPSKSVVDICLTQRKGHALISIQDQGTGVEADDLPHIFDRFYQTPKGRRRGGTGLGLAVAKWIVTEHGGDIYAKNIENGGVSIELSFPLEQKGKAA